MNFLKTFLAVLVGFLLGAALFHPRTAKAAGNVYVKQVEAGVYKPYPRIQRRRVLLHRLWR
jgi:hypothetical protein